MYMYSNRLQNDNGLETEELQFKVLLFLWEATKKKDCNSSLVINDIEASEETCSHLVFSARSKDAVGFRSVAVAIEYYTSSNQGSRRKNHQSSISSENMRDKDTRCMLRKSLLFWWSDHPCFKLYDRWSPGRPQRPVPLEYPQADCRSLYNRECRNNSNLRSSTLCAQGLSICCCCLCRHCNGWRNRLNQEDALFSVS